MTCDSQHLLARFQVAEVATNQMLVKAKASDSSASTRADQSSLTTQSIYNIYTIVNRLSWNPIEVGIKIFRAPPIKYIVRLIIQSYYIFKQYP